MLLKLNKATSSFLFIYIIINIVLLLAGQSCSTDGCTQTTELILIPEMALNLLGLLYAAILVVFHARKELFLSFLLLGIIFESTILFFQFKNGIFCVYCFFIWLQITIMFLINAFWQLKKTPMFLLAALAVPITVAFAFLILKVDSVFLDDETLEFSSEYTLITSSGCKFCEETKEFFEEEGIECDEVLVEESKSALMLLSALKIKRVPVLIVKNDEVLIVEGPSSIKEYFEQKSFLVGGEQSSLTLERATGNFFDFGKETEQFFKKEEKGCEVLVDCDE